MKKKKDNSPKKQKNKIKFLLNLMKSIQKVMIVKAQHKIVKIKKKKSFLRMIKLKIIIST